MKLTCASCPLRLESFHFIKGKRLFSICDLCRLRGLNFEDYYNYSNQVYAQVIALNYCGASKVSAATKQNITPEFCRIIEEIISEYDYASVVVKKNISRGQLNERLLAYENHEINLVNVGNFFDNLTQLGFNVESLHNLQRVDHSTRMWLYHHYHQTCQYCGRIGYSIDHINPVSRGGSNEISNLILSCNECNKLKGNMPYEWFQEFNLKTLAINQKLVINEKQINQLKSSQEALSRQLAAYSHRTRILQDDQTTIYRQRIKAQQTLLDGLNSDYQSLRNLRKNYIKSCYQIALINKKREE